MTCASATSSPHRSVLQAAWAQGPEATLTATLDGALEQAGSKDWRQRGQGLEVIGHLARQGLLTELGEASATNVVERVAQRLGDANPKVALQALEVRPCGFTSLPMRMPRKVLTPVRRMDITY
jgi:hypothetical protein